MSNRLFKQSLLALSVSGTLTLAGCGGSSSSSGGGSSLPDNYEFNSAFSTGQSAVSYTGQTMRNLLLAQLTSEIGNLTSASTNVVQTLDFYFSFDSTTSGALNHGFTTATLPVIPGPNWNAVSSGKDIVGKIAGNDDDRGNLHAGGTLFIGLSPGNTTPEQQVDDYFSQIAALVASPQTITVSGSSVETLPVYVDQYGRDYKQLTQKFITGALTYSQGSNDYLLTDWANNSVQDGSNPYTIAEHKWDEAFGYFGAARDYDGYTDDEIAGKGNIGLGDRAVYHDSNGDGSIDVRSEYNFNNSTNCAKRDRAFNGTVHATDYTQQAFDAFKAGRLILNNAAGRNLTAAEVSDLEAKALTASRVWEKCIAATVVHYINDTIADLQAVNGGVFSDKTHYLDLAKHFSEMRGFAIGLQFNPRSPFRDDALAFADLQTVLDNIGEAPVLADGTQQGIAYNHISYGAGITGYIAALLDARDILQNAYGFTDHQAQNW